MKVVLPIKLTKYFVFIQLYLKASESSKYEECYPIQRGAITNWEDITALWHHIFDKELEISPEKLPLLLTNEAMCTPVGRVYTILPRI